LAYERPVFGLPQTFKHFALDAMGHLGKLNSFLTRTRRFSQLHAPTDLTLDRKSPLSIFI